MLYTTSSVSRQRGGKHILVPFLRSGKILPQLSGVGKFLVGDLACAGGRKTSAGKNARKSEKGRLLFHCISVGRHAPASCGVHRRRLQIADARSASDALRRVAHRLVRTANRPDAVYGHHRQYQMCMLTIVPSSINPGEHDRLLIDLNTGGCSDPAPAGRRRRDTNLLSLTHCPC